MTKILTEFQVDMLMFRLNHGMWEEAIDYAEGTDYELGLEDEIESRQEEA